MNISFEQSKHIRNCLLGLFIELLLTFIEIESRKCEI